MRRKMQDLFIARRQYFHAAHDDIFTACYGFTPEYMHAFSHNRDVGKASEPTKESMRFLKKMVKPSDWANFLADLHLPPSRKRWMQQIRGQCRIQANCAEDTAPPVGDGLPRRVSHAWRICAAPSRDKKQNR